MPKCQQTRPPASGPITLEFISTGSIRARKHMISQLMTTSSPLLRRLRSFTCFEWTEPFPIAVFLIRHPDGPILFDTGESVHCNKSGYKPFYGHASFILTQTTIAPGDGIVDQLKQRGVKPSDLQAIVISHLHHDHAGGLEELAKEAPEVPVYVNRKHWEAFGKHPFVATVNGCAPNRWPKGFAPRMLEAVDNALGPWKKTYPITSDRRVVAVDTPGHVPGHISLVVFGKDGEGEENTFLLTADAADTIQCIDDLAPDGVTDDPKTSLKSLELIREYAASTDVVILPSHDSKAPELLKSRTVYKARD